MGFVFLETECTGHALDPQFQALLGQAETALRDEFASLQPHPTDVVTGAELTFAQWCGLREASCTGGGFHAKGQAIDLNTGRNPYIATRTTNPGKSTTFGGEASGVILTQDQRRQVVAVYDRALSFFEAGLTADVGHARPGEQTEQIWRRFTAASDALTTYLAFVFKPGGPDFLRRPPLCFTMNGAPFMEDLTSNPLGAGHRLLLEAAIPAAERLPKAEALNNLTQWLADRPDLQAQGSSDDWYGRILNDHELVRIPMLSGTPDFFPPEITRNPRRGFLDLRLPVVRALRDVSGLRWGACDFGAPQDGDMMHFDMGPR